MPRRFESKLGCGSEPGPLGEGKWRPDDDPDPKPGEGALRGGVARPSPESESNLSQQQTLISSNSKKSSQTREGISDTQQIVQIPSRYLC